MAQWFYRNDKHEWSAFKPKDASLLEAAFAADAPSVPLTVGSQRYTVDLTEMSQRNDKTGTLRFLRRKAPNGEVSVRSIVWEWETDHKGHFTPYPRLTSDAIEAAYAADRLVFQVPLQVNAHDTVDMVIHFGHMHQRPVDKPTSTRAIRRVERTLTRMQTEGASPTLILPKPTITAAAPPAPTASPKKTLRARSKSPEQPAGKKGPMPEGAPTLGRLTDLPVVGPPLAVRSDLGHSSWVLINKSVLALPAHTPVQGSALAIAAFDMDDTLIRPASRDSKNKGWATFAKGPKDWAWLHETVPLRLQELHAKGYLVLIVSNQGGIKDDAVKAGWVKEKILALQDNAKVPISAVCACYEDEYRKPGPLMMELVTSHAQLYKGCTIDSSKSFYVGDAAGRVGFHTLAGREKDFSCSDRKFAYNLDFAFYTPEEWLIDGPALKFDWDGFSPEDLASLRDAKHTRAAYHSTTGPELIVMVGWPGSGKSTFYETFLKPHGYVHANRDTLGTAEKVMRVADEALKNGKSVCVDNTSPQAATRKLYLDIANKYKVPARIFHMATTRAVAQHLNIARSVLGLASRVPTIAYHKFNKEYEVPSPKMDPGFTEIVEVPLVVDAASLKAVGKRNAARLVLHSLLT